MKSGCPNRPNEEQKVCDRCHTRPAVHHTCYGATAEVRSLCLECFEQTASPQELASSKQWEHALRTGKCQYCGAPAAGGSMNGGFPGPMKTNLWCEACRLDLVEFSSRPENVIPEDFDVGDEAQMEQMSRDLAERDRRQQEFMRQRVNERKPQ